MDKPSDKVERVGGLEAKPIANMVRSQLNWSQYRRLIQIKAADKREYYELRTTKARNN